VNGFVIFPLNIYRFELRRRGFLITVGFLNPESRFFSFIFISACVSYAFFLLLFFGFVYFPAFSRDRRGWALLRFWD
jgi:hypothetical protein